MYMPCTCHVNSAVSHSEGPILGSGRNTTLRCTSIVFNSTSKLHYLPLTRFLTQPVASTKGNNALHACIINHKVCWHNHIAFSIFTLFLNSLSLLSPYFSLPSLTVGSWLSALTVTLMGSWIVRSSLLGWAELKTWLSWTKQTVSFTKRTLTETAMSLLKSILPTVVFLVSHSSNCWHDYYS